MSDTTYEFSFEAEDDLEMLPDGWGENDDIFDVDSWTGSSNAADASDEDTETDDTNADNEAESDGFPTTDEDDEAEDSADEDEEVPTTDETDEPAKLRFSATIDHKTEEVELVEADLPVIYQKAQVTDRVQAKLSKITPIYEQAERTAKILGYENAEEMLKAAADNYRDSEVEKLVSEGTPRKIAEDYVDRGMNKGAPPPDTENENLDYGRDFRAEATLLLQMYPELKGQTIPDEVLRESIDKNEHLIVTYKRMVADKQLKAVTDASKAEAKKLKKDNKILKQNAEAASRAPVRGVARGGPTKDPEDDDPFLKGFNEDY